MAVEMQIHLPPGDFGTATASLDWSMGLWESLGVKLSNKVDEKQVALKMAVVLAKFLTCYTAGGNFET